MTFRPAVWPDAMNVRAFLEHAARRIAWLHALEGAAVGFAIASTVLLAAWLADWPQAFALFVAFVLAVGSIVIRVGSRARRRSDVAPRIEQRAPGFRNVLITAAEIIAEPARVRPSIGERICREAMRIANATDTAKLFPIRRATGGLVVSVVTFSVFVVVGATRPAPSPIVLPGEAADAAITRFDVIVVPPAYTSLAADTLRDPARIEAMAGSRLQFAVRARATTVTVETLSGKQALAATDARSFTGEVTTDADGFIAIEPAAADGRTGLRRLIGLSVKPDQSPRVRIAEPARDLFFDNAAGTVAVSIEADDDIGLASLRLRYTKVSGSGENFDFADGEIPIETARVSAGRWTAKASIDMNVLALQPGDMLVYRAVATDRNPGATPTESDSWIIEITQPGSLAAGGFTLDEERDRYGISQQMVILKTERLIARAPTLTREAIAEEALAIAAEQRSVRAEFVFMMGGELADDVLDVTDVNDLGEAAEAEAEADILAGRLANRGRIELTRAIRAMSGANSLLIAAQLNDALQQERTALAHLQGAFSRTRYILRALTERERLDLSRRLTGELATVSRNSRPGVESVPDARVASLRAVLAGIASLTGGANSDAETAAGADALAEAVLRIDPTSASLQEVTTVLSGAATAIAAGRRGDARSLLDLAATRLAASLRSDMIDAVRPGLSREAARLNGALVDALSGRGMR